MLDVSNTINAIDAALGQAGGGSVPAAAPQVAAPRASTVQDTISSIDAALTGGASGGALKFDASQGSGPPQGAPADPANDTGAPPLTIHPKRKPIAAADVPGDAVQSLATGVEKGAIGLAGLPADVEGLAHRGFSAVVDPLLDRVFGAPKPVPAAVPGSLDDVARNTNDYAGSGGITKGVEAAAGPMYQPKSVVGDYAQTAGEFLPAAGRNLITAGVLPAVASETAGQLTQGTALEPYARVAGAVAGGGAGALAVGAGEAVNVGKKALQEYRLPAQPGGPEQIAGQRLATAATDPAAVGAALDKPGVILPGSQPTTFQQTGDLGLGQLERQARNGESAPQFIARDADQNNARVGAIQNTQTTGSPADVAAQFRQMRDDLDQHTQAQVDALAPAAQDANAAIGGHGTAESTGYALRQPTADARAAAKENEDKLWRLVNPDLSVPTADVAETAGRVAGEITKSATPMGGEEGRIFHVASNYADTMPFGELKDLRSAITDAKAEARQAGNTQSVRRLSMLLGSLDDALDHGIENQAAVEQIAVRRGTMSVDDTLQAQIRGFWEQNAGATRTANARAGVARTGTDAGGMVGGGTASDLGSIRTAGAPGGEPRQAPRDPRLSEQAPLFDDTEVTRRPTTPGVPRPRDLHQFIRDNGGMQDPGGDLKSMGFDRIRGFIAKPGQGLSPDHMREAAAEAGYLGADTDRAMSETTINDLHDAIGSDRAVHSVRDQDAAHAWDAYDDANEEYNRVKGPQSWSAAPPRAPTSAYGQQDAYPPGMSPNDLAASPLPPATPQDVANYAAARAATRERASTFDEGAVGDVLQQAPRGGYAMPDAAVPGRVVPQGRPTDALAVRQYLAGGGSTDTLADATAYTLRKAAALGDGTLDPGKVTSWLKQNREALAEMPPEVASKFKTAADAQQAVTDMVVKRKASMDAFNKTAVAKIAGVSDSEDVVRHVGAILTRPDAVAQMRSLAEAAAKDPAAKDGLRRSLVEHMTQKLLSNARAGATDVQQLKGDTFQNYLRANAGALRQVFTPEEMNTFNAVGRDVQRANDSIVATKGNKGSPGTAQDLLAAPKDASILTKLLLEAGPAVAGKATGGWTGAALGWLGSKVIARGRAAGLEQVDKLVTDALLNPSLAKSLLAKVPLHPDSGTAASLGSKFAGIAAKTAAGAFTSQPSAPKQQRPSPITIPPDHPLLSQARQAPDGHHYVPDPRGQGRFMRVGP